MLTQGGLRTPREPSVGTTARSINDDSYSSEAYDQLPSLPSSSSSLFMAINNHDASQHPNRRRRRVPSLYGDASVAASEDVSIEGTSTYEYDVVANLHKQQSRRRRGDSNASISTVASVLSRHPSVADSIASCSQNYQRDGHARGQFVGTRSIASSIRDEGGDGGSEFNVNMYGAAYRHGDAAASLRRIRKASGLGGADPPRGVDSTSAQPHLTDKLEQMIANSTSYRAASARRGAGRTDSGVGGAGAGAAGADGTLGARHRKNSYASIRSLMAFTPTNQRQTATGTYQQPTSSSRAASLFGVFMGNDYKTNNSMRAPAWSRPAAPTLSSVDTGTVTHRTAATGQATASYNKPGQQPRDAIGSLRGLRGLFDVPPADVQKQGGLTSPNMKSQGSRPALLTRNGTGSSSAASTTKDATEAAKQPSPSERQRHVSFQAGEQSSLPPPPNVYARRAFASIDPTTNGTPSGTATPGTVRSISPPLGGSRVNSHTDLSRLTASGDASATTLQHSNHNSSSSSSIINLAGSGQHSRSSTPTSPNGGGAMPALDEALARAEDRSGLKTSSRCATCDKRVVNAPVTKTGEVFCSRECRIMMKQRRREADKKAAAAAATAAAAPAASSSTLAKTQTQAPAEPAVAPTASTPTAASSIKSASKAHSSPSPSSASIHSNRESQIEPAVEERSAGHAVAAMLPAIST